MTIYEVVTYISGILYYVSTTINPILYHTMSLKFREAFKVSTIYVNHIYGFSHLHIIYKGKVKRSRPSLRETRDKRP